MDALNSFLRKLEVDSRMLGMVATLVVIWVGIDLLADGRFLTPRNLFNLSVQTASVAVMAAGMVLVIITRNIDLSVGSILGVTAMVMGVIQTDWLPQWLGLGHPAIWIVTALAGVLIGALIGALNGTIIGYLGVPSFIVTLGGLLIWRGAAWWVTQGRTVAPLDQIFILLGGGIEGTLGAFWSWIAGFVVAAGIIATTLIARRRRIAFNFPVKPVWAEFLTAGALIVVVLGFVATVNAYNLPQIAVERIAKAKGLIIPPEGLQIAHGLAIPVVIVIVAAFIVSVLLRRTRFGRYVFAMGGNMEAAERAGVDTRAITFWVFVLMGALCGLSASIASARLQSANNDIGTLDELRVIAAAVIGGSSLAGGVGTVYGALLGAIIIQSLQSGMALLGLDTSLQNIIIGAVLVLAVWIDQVYQRHRRT